MNKLAGIVLTLTLLTTGGTFGLTSAEAKTATTTIKALRNGSPARFRTECLGRHWRFGRLSGGFRRLYPLEAPRLLAEPKAATPAVWFLREPRPAPGP